MNDRDYEIFDADYKKSKMDKIDRKKIIIAIAIIITVIIVIITIAGYMGNREFREFIDINILRKSVQENNLPYISLDENENYNIYAYDKYIAVLHKNNLIQYNSSGKEENRQTVEIATPLVCTNNRFLLLADKDKQKIYLFSGNNKVWEKELEGNITKITVNKNGYVAVILSGTTYKSVVQTFDDTGKELFKTYHSNSIAVSAEISKNNKYLAVGEVSTTGTAIQSRVKIISIETVKEQEESIIYTYNAPSNSLLINMKYQNNDKLICMYDDEIHVIQNKQDEILTNIKQENQKITFASIELEEYIFRIIEKTIILSTQDNLEIVSVANKSEAVYTIDRSIKEVYSYEDTIAINLGSEVHFIGTNGWLIKKYISTQEVKNIVIASNFAGIVYRNKIELIQI